jgi:transposase-like protein
VFEHGRIPLHKMLQAVYLLTSSKKGISSHQLSRTLEIQYKSAWFLAHRIREAMRDGSLAPFGGDRGIVEIDETYIGRVKGEPKARGGTRHKMKVLSLVDRRTGRSRSFVVDNTKIATVLPIIRANVAQEAICITDEAGIYTKLNKHGYDHGVVNHSADEWVRGLVHTNTIEGFFGIFKRGFKGIYQHCAEKNLHRYMAEYDFRYSNRQGNGVGDSQRAEIALKGIVGKRITYRWPD